MLVLGIETSTSLGSVAIWDSDDVVLLARVSATISAAHSENLIPNIEFIINESGKSLKDIGLIAVSIGPGSFTGLRVGLLTAKGLALANNIPVVGVDTLMACAYPYLGIGKRVGSMLDAKRGEIYGAIYKMNDSITIEHNPSIITLSEFVNTINDNKIDCITGDVHLLENAQLNPEIFVATSGFNLPDAVSVAKIGLEMFYKNGAMDISDLSPEYLRHFTPGKPRL
jgi:tRNA threonylcarbamoyladenosine biosynthesis protein TsaB